MLYHHIFFHSLVVDPELAFRDGLGLDQDFETWMITVKEYQAFIKSLYERNYVLVRLADLAEGNLCLPEGKIPLVISFDDVNYYEFMKGCGFADRLVVDEDGNLANRYIDRDGNSIITREADGVPILEAFIEEHPDFSYQGARGILAITGYEGILGYHDIVGEREEILQVVDALKKHGWEFACHSFGHKRRTFCGKSFIPKQYEEDTRQWICNVGSLVGENNIYISPFGVHMQEDPAALRYLREQGFRYFCDVDNSHRITENEGVICIPRVNIDGFLFQYRNYEMDLFYADVDDVLDPGRRREYRHYGLDGYSLAMHGINMAKFFDHSFQKEDGSDLITSYLMGGMRHYQWQSELDYDGETLYAKASNHGPIESLPEKRGVCLYRDGQVGIYIGKGRVVWNKKEREGQVRVVQEKVDREKWTQWFLCPGIEYEEVDESNGMVVEEQEKEAKKIFLRIKARVRRGLQILWNTLPYWSKNVYYYNQRSLRYFFYRYDSSFVGLSACGPFACAMVAATLKKEKIDPITVVKWAEKNQYYMPGYGSLHSLVPDYFQTEGLVCEDLGFSIEALQKRLMDGNTLGILLCKKGTFSAGGHFIVVGAAGDRFKVYNSSNVFDCYRTFDGAQLEDALARDHVYIGPIWCISKRQEEK